MKSKVSFTFMWAAMVAILGVFSAVTYNELSGNSTTKAYAATMSQDQALQSAKTMVSVKNADQDFGDNHHGSKPGKHETLCALNNYQLGILKAQFDAKVVTFETDGSQIMVVQVDQDQLSPAKIRLLRQTLSGSHCQGVSYGNSLFYILFRGDVS